MYLLVVRGQCDLCRQVHDGTLLGVIHDLWEPSPVLKGSIIFHALRMYDSHRNDVVSNLGNVTEYCDEIAVWVSGQRLGKISSELDGIGYGRLRAD